MMSAREQIPYAVRITLTSRLHDEYIRMGSSEKRNPLKELICIEFEPASRQARTENAP